MSATIFDLCLRGNKGFADGKRLSLVFTFSDSINSIPNHGRNVDLIFFLTLSRYMCLLYFKSCYRESSDLQGIPDRNTNSIPSCSDGGFKS